MKIELKLTIEIDREATCDLRFPVANLCPSLLIGDVNRQLRGWIGSNPYNLTEPEHVALKIETLPACQCASLRHFVAEELRASLRQLNEIARIVEVK